MRRFGDLDAQGCKTIKEARAIINIFEMVPLIAEKTGAER
jgi:hypothetical protein